MAPPPGRSPIPPHTSTGWPTTSPSTSADRTCAVGSITILSASIYATYAAGTVAFRKEAANATNEKIKDYNVRVTALNAKVFEPISCPELLDSLSEQVCELIDDKALLDDEAFRSNNLGGFISWPRLQRGLNLLQPCDFPIQSRLSITGGSIEKLLKEYKDNSIESPEFHGRYYRSLLQRTKLAETQFIQLAPSTKITPYEPKVTGQPTLILIGAAVIVGFSLVGRFALPRSVLSMAFLIQGDLASSPPIMPKLRLDVLLVALIYAWSIGTRIYLNTTLIYVGSSVLIYMSERMPLLDWYLSTVGGGINKGTRLVAQAVTIAVVAPFAVLYEFGGFMVDAVKLLPTGETIYGETVKLLSGVKNSTTAAIFPSNSSFRGPVTIDVVVHKKQVQFQNNFPLKPMWELKSFVGLENCETFYIASWIGCNGVTYLECVLIEIRGNVIFLSWF